MTDRMHQDVLRKWKCRDNETPEQCEKRQACDWENKTKKAAKTKNQRKARLVREREQKRKRRALNKGLSLESVDKFK
ncbi:1271_t:CDS:2 [Diversispora eburnea]|uniref:1271_t:CDS:1 n=1 Tax=Diversispora eburnea TaxID=1213867 RepID=A0A9N9CJN1_9GLOM|nr:1271_t:CDS:2 [Diversispora eburnea]